jgi:hypothetical protein
MLKTSKKTVKKSVEKTSSRKTVKTVKINQALHIIKHNIT